MNQNKPTSQITGILEKLFKEQIGVSPESITPLAASGSDRQYFRLKSGNISVIGTYNNNGAENNTFFYVSELLRKHQINIPEVVVINNDRKAYLQTDLGNVTLFDLLIKEGYTDKILKYFQTAVAELAKIQWVVGRDADFRQCFAAKQFDEKAIMADLLYFKYYFADLQQIPYDRNLMMNELELLSKDLGRTQPQTFMYRDFQSRNIMVHEGKLYFIDYQGFMQGPPQYDLASLLWQARAQLPAKWKEELINTYIKSLEDLHISRIDEIYFRRGYVQFVLVRLVQVLGAYGFRGLFQRKEHFIFSIGPALKNLNNFLENHPQTPSYPELRKLLEAISNQDMQKKFTLKTNEEKPKLIVDIYSFSYKNGIPKTNSHHGGGYVFDCRGIVNPGRYDDYKFYTGNDEKVMQFLERETNMPEFINHVFALVSINVQDYISRGFEQLSVGFGCTGGQHRSVYSANQLAAYLKNRFNVDVVVNHLNEKNWRLYEN